MRELGADGFVTGFGVTLELGPGPNELFEGLLEVPLPHTRQRRRLGRRRDLFNHRIKFRVEAEAGHKGRVARQDAVVGVAHFGRILDRREVSGQTHRTVEPLGQVVELEQRVKSAYARPLKGVQIFLSLRQRLVDGAFDLIGRLRTLRRLPALLPEPQHQAAAAFVARFSALVATAPWPRFTLEVNPIVLGDGVCAAVDGLLLIAIASPAMVFAIAELARALGARPDSRALAPTAFAAGLLSPALGIVTNGFSRAIERRALQHLSLRRELAALSEAA